MSHYLLYFPGATEPDESLFSQGGLSRLRNCGLPIFWQAVMQRGPDDGAGMIAAWVRGDGDRDTDPNSDTIKWRPATENGNLLLDDGWFWFGVDEKRPVEPIDLQLAKRYPGHDVPCADGNIWHIPAAAKLPHSHGLNPLGEWARKVAPQYEEFAGRSMDYALDIWRELDAVDAVKDVSPDVDVSGQTVPITLHDADEHCCNALAMNYRVCPEVVDMLGLLNDATMIGIISATIDLPQIMEVLEQKKKYCPVGIPIG